MPGEVGKVPFDPKVFLATVDCGRTISRSQDSFCGEGCLTGQPLRMATATAMTECEIMRQQKTAIIRVLHEEPAFSEMFIAWRRAV